MALIPLKSCGLLAVRVQVPPLVRLKPLFQGLFSFVNSGDNIGITNSYRFTFIYWAVNKSYGKDALLTHPASLVAFNGRSSIIHFDRQQEYVDPDIQLVIWEQTSKSSCGLF